MRPPPPPPKPPPKVDTTKVIEKGIGRQITKIKTKPAKVIRTLKAMTSEQLLEDYPMKFRTEILAESLKTTLGTEVDVSGKLSQVLGTTVSKVAPPSLKVIPISITMPKLKTQQMLKTDITMMKEDIMTKAFVSLKVSPILKQIPITETMTRVAQIPAMDTMLKLDSMLGLRVPPVTEVVQVPSMRGIPGLQAIPITKVPPPPPGFGWPPFGWLGRGKYSMGRRGLMKGWTIVNPLKNLPGQFFTRFDISKVVGGQTRIGRMAGMGKMAGVGRTKGFDTGRIIRRQTGRAPAVGRIGMPGLGRGRRTGTPASFGRAPAFDVGRIIGREKGKMKGRFT